MNRPLPAPRPRPLLVAALLLLAALLAGAAPSPPGAAAETPVTRDGPVAGDPLPVEAVPPSAPPVPAGSVVAAGSGAGSGWQAPVSGPLRVLRPFAPGPQPWSPGHRGVDLALAAGSPVLAAGGGRVVFAGPVGGRGVVSVAHGGLRTTYEPLLPAVSSGEVVRGGAVLGELAPGHLPCGACLHWGLRRGDDYLDPLRLLRPTRVRLLPLGPWPG